MYIYLSTYLSIYMYTYIRIYAYIYWSRQAGARLGCCKRAKGDLYVLYLSTYLSIYIYTYTYIRIYILEPPSWR